MAKGNSRFGSNLKLMPTRARRRKVTILMIMLLRSSLMARLILLPKGPISMRTIQTKKYFTLRWCLKIQKITKSSLPLV